MKVTTTFELRPEQALEMLCKTLHMDFAFTDDDSFYIKEDPMTGSWLFGTAMKCMMRELICLLQSGM